MMQADEAREVRLTLPAEQAYAPVAALALSGLGMLLGLDMDLLGDLRTVTGECIDCLLHQAGRPRRLEMTAWVETGWFRVCFMACDRANGLLADALSLEITRGVLETLMPQVCLEADGMGVRRIECSMPV